MLSISSLLIFVEQTKHHTSEKRRNQKIHMFIMFRQVYIMIFSLLWRKVTISAFRVLNVPLFEYNLLCNLVLTFI